MYQHTPTSRSSRRLTLLLCSLFLILLSGSRLLAQSDSVGGERDVQPDASAVNKIYWTDKDDQLIGRSNADGSDFEVLVEDVDNPRGIALNIPGGKMYWADQEKDQILRANLNGTNVEVFLAMSKDDLPNNIALDLQGEKIYWTARAQTLLRGRDGIWRANLDGSEREMLVNFLDGLDWPVGIALDLPRGKMYWAELRNARIRRANLDGSNIETVLNATDGLRRPMEVALDLNNDLLYWTDEEAATIRRADLNGNNVQKLLGPEHGLEQPRGLALDLAGGKMYWTDKEAKRIQRANLDGSGLETLLDDDDGLNYPLSLALDLGGGVTCYPLALRHTGSGAPPTAAPESSPGCQPGTYSAGESISLTAAPADGWSVERWEGTNNNSSSSTTNILTMPAASHTVTVRYKQNPPNCYRLTLAHSGMGDAPAASPPSSPGCGDGLYREGTAISLTAAPDTNWVVERWEGTNNDNSTATTNSLTMPANDHTVTVHYIPTIQCYKLTRIHTGSGSDPAAEPESSPGCAPGQYTAGATIALTADPTEGWQVKNWNGTVNDTLTTLTNQAMMPAANHTIIVNYEPIPCYRLTRTHQGEGSDPLATPSRSSFCGTGEFVAGELITLQANPANGWSVGGWNGTNNDNSQATTNTLTMPSGAHTVSVRYSEAAAVCYQLTLNHSGQGATLAATPPRSEACSASHYVQGEVITLNATPAIGWQINGWSGTADDSSQTATNSLTMPAANHTVVVRYAKANAIFMPMATYGLPPDCFQGPGEQEPNNKADEATGPICPWIPSLQGFPNDNYDFFTFETTAAGPITIRLLNHTNSGVQVRLYYQEYVAGNSVALGFLPPDYRLTWEGAPGLYYILVFTDSPVSGTTQPYTLEVTRPK